MNRIPALSMPLIVSLLSAAPLAGCVAGAEIQRPASPASCPSDPLGDHVLQPLPLWADKYSNSDSPPPPSFAIRRLMERYALTRAQAVELQNHYRDQLRAKPNTEPKQAFDVALERVRSNQFERPLDVEQLRQAKFIVVFDLDETLWSQYNPKTVTVTCFDFTIPEPMAAGTPNVQLVPGWQQAFERIRALGGAVVLFSANLDDPTLARLAQWKFHGTPLTQSPEIAGILTNSHLILQDKAEGPNTGNPVREPSKDLRIFNADNTDKDDKVSDKVIIVDDNPTRLFNDQLTHARVIKKFEAKHYCASPGDALLRKAFDDSLAEVVREIEESVQYMEKQPPAKRSFAKAFLPYSWLGQPTVRFLMDNGGLDRAKAIDAVRSNPAIVDSKF
ncbi:NIF family HAD-type phosphatase [Stigmatella sp. ncwal1]|uniref:NIF family HAD-type phosphatase n=1 Tax=Stigmatella ashevillensis TaxID=2995309 RepID=A0ABT5DPV8_9BACT|nr:NIF family HAD-type phosphatase [Stigmatella ashevillena]MDC0715089.1 NIF family HAD-type phosphatase [Stigmatella ashevillena]